MNVKICVNKNNASARSGVRYILGYSLGSGAKNQELSAEERRGGFHRLMAEAMRSDYGVEKVFEPKEGDGKRPAAIFAHGVSSLATADIEMAAHQTAGRNWMVREPTLHWVYSFSTEETKWLTNEQVVRLVIAHLEHPEISLGSNQFVIALHRDTENVHAHLIANAIGKEYTPWTRHRQYHRVSFAARDIELHSQELIGAQLSHDHGLYRIREHNGLPRIELSSAAELAAWRRETVEHKLEDKAVKLAQDYTHYVDQKEWSESVIAPRLKEYVDAEVSRGEEPQFALMHNIVARYGGRLSRDTETGQLAVQIMVRAEGEGQDLQIQDVDPNTETVPERQAKQRPSGAPTLIDPESIVGVDPRPNASPYQTWAYAERAKVLPQYVDAVTAEDLFLSKIHQDPGYVSREIVAGGQGLFSVEEIDEFLSRGCTSSSVIAETSIWIEQHDSTLRIVSGGDTPHPIYTTVAQQQLTARVAEKAEILAKSRDRLFDAAKLNQAIAEVEKRRGITIDPEQRKALSGQHSLNVLQGESGSGKTILMECLNRMAALEGREIRGLTTAQLAAGKLEFESGVLSMNSTRALMHEEGGKHLVAKDSVLILDESSMLDMQHADKLLSIAIDRGVTIYAIGDRAQLPPIGAGDPFRIMTEAAQRHDGYHELHKVYRQKGALEFQRPIVAEMGRAIREGDAAGVTRGIMQMNEHKIFSFCEDREETLRKAAEFAAAAYKRGEPILVTVDNKEDQQFLNSEIRSALGFEGGTLLKSERGGIRLCAGERIIFKENSAHLGVLNGMCAVVENIEFRNDNWHVSARLDHSDKRVDFLPETFRKWNSAWSQTVHSAQGQSVSASTYVITHPINVRLANVGWTRAENTLRVFVSRSAYGTPTDLAETIASRLESKRDVMFVSELEKQFGGRDNFWSINVRRAMDKHSDPLFQSYLREEVRPKEEQRQSDLAKINAKYQAKSKPDISAKKAMQLELAQRRESAKVIKETTPNLFVEFCADPVRAQAIIKQSEITQNAEQIRRDEQTHKHEKRIEPLAHEINEQQHTRDDELSHTISH